MKSVTQQYELTFILGEKVSPEEGQKKAESVKALIEKLGGTNQKEELWGRRELAYIIKRNRSGFYITLWIDFPTNKIPELEQELRFDESVIRFLTTKAYTSAQPGTLYPVAEEKPEKGSRDRDKDEKTSGEEQLRRTSGTTTSKVEDAVEVADDLPEEERLEKLDEVLEDLLKDPE